MRHGGDRRERLAAEAHRPDGLKPLLIVQLGGGVTQEGDARVLRGHAAAVVRHADIGRAAAAKFHRDILRAGVEGVLHQLLDNGGGTLHDLAGGDHISHVRVENIDNSHMHTSFSVSIIIPDSC